MKIRSTVQTFCNSYRPRLTSATIAVALFLLINSWPLYGQQVFNRAFAGVPFNDSGISAGAALTDYNGDGHLDLYIANWGNQDNVLYLNRGNANFVKITEGAIVHDGGMSSGPAWGDYDNDGAPDLFVANQQNQNNFLYHNNGDGTFDKVTDGDMVNDYGDSYSAAWADYDLDGFLDLYVANGSGQPNLLYHNQGDGSFTRVDEGAITTDPGTSFGCAWGDYDEDGFPDLFVANKGDAPNRLYHNNGDGTFTSIVNTPIATDGGNSNGGSWGDFDNDDDLDLFVANGPFFYQGQNNFLYRNDGDGVFTAITSGFVVTDGAKSMSGVWADFDLDGHLDLFVTNYIHDDLLYLNNGDGTFTPKTDDLIVNMAGFATGVAAGDLDDDGDPDLFVANWENQNNTGYYANGVNNWLRVKLVGESSNRDAVGAQVAAVAKIGQREIRQTREVTAGFGFRSQGSLDLYFGMGDATQVDILEVHWPGGKVEVLAQIPTNQTIVITQGRGLTANRTPPVQMGRPSVAPLLMEIINAQGVTAAVQRYQDLKKRGDEEYNLSEGSLNGLGYQLLQAGNKAAAIEILDLNRRENPKSANAYDSLAEAHMVLGNTKEALKYTRKMLKVLPKDETLSEDFRTQLENSGRYRLKHLK